MEFEIFMKEALLEAEKARAIGEVPIGAVVVQNGQIVGRGYNRRETDKDPTLHAEMIAIQDAAKRLGGWRLTNCDLYVTIEPCMMCAGAIYQSRIIRLIVGASDPKMGAVGSLYNLLDDDRLNHSVEVHSGIMAEECSSIVKDFFKDLRKKKK